MVGRSVVREAVVVGNVVAATVVVGNVVASTVVVGNVVVTLCVVIIVGALVVGMIVGKMNAGAHLDLHLSSEITIILP